MIKEICQFIETLEEQTPDLFEEGAILKEGIYVALDIQLEDGQYVLKNIDENGNILKEDIGLFTKKEEINPFFERCQMILKYSRPVSQAKIFDPIKKIFNLTCSPFVLGFTKKNFDKNLETIGKKGIMDESIKRYFNRAKDFIEEGNQKICFERFKNLMKDNLWDLLEKIDYSNLNKNYSVVFFLKNLSIEDFIIPYQKYVVQNVFNKADYNINYNGTTYGISDSLSSFNDKKPFLQHQTASFRYNYRINNKDAQLIWKFYQLCQNEQLPNPLPIFVNKEEADLNSDVVKLFNTERVESYSEIIKSLLDLRNNSLPKYKRTNLQNFYLLFFQKRQIIDLDFVPVFKYNIKDKTNNDFTIKELFRAEPAIYFNSKEHNVFDFETMIVNPLFNNQLIQKTKRGSLWIKYFEDIEIKPNYGLTEVIYNLMYKYRKAWYDFIYKSKQQTITMTMIYEMFKDSIVDDLRHDDKLKKTDQIRKKLSLWFGVQPLFDNNLNTNNMANKTVELQKKIREIAQNESLHITTDDEFAFASGQLIWKLLIQSESANRSHALLEPFLQKTSPILFKQAIANTFNIYKHKFAFYPIKYEFDKLFSEVMGYDPEIKNIKELLPMILAGYFSESIFKKQ